MGIAAKQVKVGNSQFTIMPLPALTTWDLQPRLAPLLGEVGRAWAASALLIKTFTKVLGAKPAVEGAAPDVLDLDVTELQPLFDVVLPALERICRLLPKGELAALLRELLEGATITLEQGGLLLFGARVGENLTDPFNQLMQGRMGDVWKLLFAALQVNYPDFFRGFVTRGSGEPSATSATASPSAT